MISGYYIYDFKTNGLILESFPCEKFPAEKNLRGGRNSSHGKLSKIIPYMIDLQFQD